MRPIYLRKPRSKAGVHGHFWRGLAIGLPMSLGLWSAIGAAWWVAVSDSEAAFFLRATALHVLSALILIAAIMSVARRRLSTRRLAVAALLFLASAGCSGLVYQLHTVHFCSYLEEQRL